MRRRMQGLAVVTSDLNPLPVCGDGPQARPRKESVAFNLQSCRKGGMEDEHEPPLQPRTQHIQEFTNETWRMRTGRPLPDQLVPLLWSLIVSLYPVGGLLGALLAGPLAITLGRKKSLLVNNIFVVAAATLFGFSRRAGSFEMIMLGRLLVGVSAGVSMNVQPMYLGESAPKELRGAVAMTSAIFTALGIVMGQVVGLRELLGGPQAWPLLLASCLVPGVLQLASLPLLPESPRYLLIDRGDSEACLAALQRLRGPADLAGELAELERERAACQGRRARRPWELFRDRALRRQVASLVVLGGVMELCGNDAVYAYASAVFSQARIPPEKVQYASIGTGGCELLAALLSCVVIERVGRRMLLMAGYGLMTCWGSVFTAALCLQSSLPWMPYLAMSCVFAFILSFGIGPGEWEELLPLGLAEGSRMSRRACPTSSMCLSSVSVSVGPSTLASSSLRPEARASWTSQRNCTDSTSPGWSQGPTWTGRRSSGPQNSSSAGLAGAQPAAALPSGPLHSPALHPLV
ncbi:solute carrier family 2, facilitated glucose transporter member 11 isoform X3 [Eubalaena glacialis]|uniref:solute carrier family 2, facilitated glucose transporter member 11 isoform X3 n=1 Tax=Eubalaena glacialis TaxID=27606 RepID=UPI002A5A7BF8|nr:solute carrier family 2, facilitated glucose transporter member 11 isoform X3 [Eubalaena glacialis]